MKPVTVITGALAISAGAVLLTGSGHAKEKPKVDPDTITKSETDKAQNEKNPFFVRSSQVMGMNITNRKGKDVGEINDLVLDAANGKVRYAAVTYGGFLGIGEKMFAVPFDAFKLKREPKENQISFILNIKQKQLKGASGFDQSHWPDFSDKSLIKELDQRYRVKRNQQVKAKSDSGKTDEPTSSQVIRVSQLMGMPFQNTEGNQIGKVEEIVLDTAHHKARYLVVVFNEKQKKSDKLFAVPFQTFQVRMDSQTEKPSLVLKVTPEQMQGAQGFDPDQWPEFTNPVFRKELLELYLFKTPTKNRGVKVDIET